MKTRSVLFHFIWIAFILLFTACSDDKDEPEDITPPPTLNSDKQMISFTLEATKNGLKKNYRRKA